MLALLSIFLKPSTFPDPIYRALVASRKELLALLAFGGPRARP